MICNYLINLLTNIISKRVLNYTVMVVKCDPIHKLKKTEPE